MPLYAVTVLATGSDILGNPLPAEGVLETRTYAANSEDHARQSAQLALLDTEEIVSVCVSSEDH